MMSPYILHSSYLTSRVSSYLIGAWLVTHAQRAFFNLSNEETEVA